MKPACTRLLALCACLLVIAACARGPRTPSPGEGEIADLRVIPQDLTAFVGRDGDRPLIDSAGAREQYERYRARFFAPWDMTKPSIAKKDVVAMLSRKARGWKGTVPWKEDEWRRMAANGDGKSYPNMTAHGITLRPTDLREMPTRQPRFTELTPDPKANPFDYFQYSRLHQGTPLLLCQRSRDGRWYYVETPLAGGWVDARDVAEVTPAFKALYRAAPLGAVTREGTAIGRDQRADIGAVLPLGSVGVLVPAVSNGALLLVDTPVDEGAVAPMPVTMTPGAVAGLGNALLGQAYGWGGMLGLRDCSSTTRDLMAPFAVWLPRNSRAQGQAGEAISLAGMDVADKERLVMSEAVPFASLLVMKGHVALYVGKYRGRPAILHNIWGIRIQGGPDSNRLVIGRDVITSMTPGAELPNLVDGKTIGERFHTVTILGGARD